MEMRSQSPAGACGVLSGLGEKLPPFILRTMDSLRNGSIGSIIWRGGRRWHGEFYFGKIIWLNCRPEWMNQWSSRRYGKGQGQESSNGHEEK